MTTQDSAGDTAGQVPTIQELESRGIDPLVYPGPIDWAKTIDELRGRAARDGFDLPGQFLTLAQAAESLGLSEKTIRAQVKAGQVAAERHSCVCAGQVVGSQQMVARAEVERYRRESLGKPGPRATRQ